MALAALLTAVASPAAAAEVRACATGRPAPAPVQQALDAVLADLPDPDGAGAAEFGPAPGAVLRVEAPSWTYHAAAGVADPATGEALHCGAPFQIGSSTKMMIGTLLMQLQEEGALDLDDPLPRHLPEIAAALPNGGGITLRQLATHTAGVYSYTDDAPDGTPGILEGILADPSLLARRYMPGDLVDFAIAHGRPEFEPGGGWSYSNTGYILLGMVIETVTGKPLDHLLAERIFDPLGMDRTVLWDGVPPPELGLPRSWYSYPSGPETTGWNLSQGWAAGAVISTAEDMSTFLRALFDGRLFRSRDTLAGMTDGVPVPRPGYARYAIGVVQKLPGAWGHDGQTMGYLSDMAWFGRDRIGVVVWTNSAMNPAIGALRAIADALSEAGTAGGPE